MVRRNVELSFGGMWTFPGGGLEAADGPYPTKIEEAWQDWSDEDLLRTARLAAAREAREEAAIACSLESMIWFSHWIPPDEFGPPKRFATWFFLAPDSSGEVVVDRSENSDARWVRPQDALDEYAAGEFPVAVPTWVTLDDLRHFPSIEHAANASLAEGPRIHHTRSIRRGESAMLLWPGDAGYVTSELTADGPRNRVLMSSSGVVLERSYG